MEFVMVVFATERSVYVDGTLTGVTNESLLIDAGSHRFDLGLPADYKPASQDVVVAETTALLPLKVVFTKKRG